MKLVPRQRTILKRYLRDSPKILILEGAVRSGKTFLNNAIFYMLVRGQTGAGKHFIITGHTLGSIKRNVLEPMSMDLGLNAKMDNNGMLRMFGNFVHCFGSDRADSYKAMTGMTGAGWYANEVTLQHDNSIQEAFNRCSDPDAQIIWDTNPDYPEHPIKLNFIDCSGERLSSGRLRIQAFHFQLDDNPTLSGEYIENLKRSTASGMWYDRRIKGLWTAAEGLVYEDWNPEVHVVDPFPIPEDWPRYRAIDLGYNNPFVCLWGAQDHDGRLYIYQEYFKNHTLITDHAKKIKQLSGIKYDDAGKITDKGEKYLWTVSDHDAQERLEYESHDIPTKPANKAVTLGIEYTAQRMAEQIDKRPRVMIFDTCTELIRQIGTYRWRPSEEGKPYKEEPLKVDDDGPDVLRYMITELDHNSSPIIKAGFRGYAPRR